MTTGGTGTTIRTTGTTTGDAEMTIGLPRKSRRNVTTLR